MGASTHLLCQPATAIECLFQIDVMLTHVDDGVGGLVGYDILLTETYEGECVGYTSDLVHTPPGTLVEDAGTIGPPIHLGGSTFSTSWVGADYLLASFLLHKPCDVEGFNYIWAGTDPNGYGWANDDYTSGPVVWGGNPGISGYPGYYAPNPVITVECIPEPTTIALVGLGFLGLIRRR
jgi:hypothetical protein